MKKTLEMTYEDNLVTLNEGVRPMIRGGLREEVYNGLEEFGFVTAKTAYFELIGDGYSITYNPKSKTPFEVVISNEHDNIFSQINDKLEDILDVLEGI